MIRWDSGSESLRQAQAATEPTAQGRRRPGAAAAAAPARRGRPAGDRDCHGHGDRRRPGGVPVTVTQAESEFLTACQCQWMAADTVLLAVT